MRAFVVPLALAALLAAPFAGAADVDGIGGKLKEDRVEPASATTGRVRGTGGIGLNLRAKPWGKVLGLLDEGSALKILARDGDWLKVEAGSRTGWVHGDWVKAGGGAAADDDGKTATRRFVDVPAGQHLNVRAAPWGRILDQVGRGEALEVVSEKGDWRKVRFGKDTAWVHADYLAAKKPDAKAKDRDEPKADSQATAKKPDDGKAGADEKKGDGKGWGGRPLRGGHITSGYGYRTDPDTKKRLFHHGIDIGAAAGTPVYSLGPGRVVFAGWQDAGGGNVVMVKHDNGYLSIYGHLKGYSVKVGERVKRGQRLGGVNSTGYSTGDHLHFGLMKNGRYVNPAATKGVNL